MGNEAGELDLANALARFAVETPDAAIAADAHRVAALSLLDWCAVGIAGADEPVAKIIRADILRDGGRAEAGLLGSVERVPARAAALTNGTTSHALDYDDTHFLHVGHPSVGVIPAVTAVAEAERLPGARVLPAALIGMEASCRVGHWLGSGHYNTGFHQTATAGAFGATLAAARLLGLDRSQTIMALGIASTRASGLKSQFGTMGKPLNAGLAASTGVEAARLAVAGFVSTPAGLTGPQGFGETHARDGVPVDQALAGLGERWVFEEVSHKFHACCHGLHAMLEAIGALPSGSFDPKMVDRIEVVTTPRWLRVCNIPSPATGLEAKFSYRLTAAMALAGRDTGALATYDAAACSDPELLMLRDKVSVVTDPEMAETAATVKLHLKDGRVLEASHDLSVQPPLDHRIAKVRAKSSALLGTDHARSIDGRIDALSTSLEPFTLSWLLHGQDAAAAA
ncbi:MAG: MmgE/PrpD family protein [Pseudomonadota bacterium]